MSVIKNIRLKGVTYGITDSNTLPALNDAQRAILLATGTYLEKEVENNKVFETTNGTFERFTKTLVNDTYEYTLTDLNTNGLKNTATGTNAITIGSVNASTGQESVNIGYNSNSNGLRSIALGSEAKSTSTGGIAIGYDSQATQLNSEAIGGRATATASLIIGRGINSEANTFKVALVGSSAAMATNESTGLYTLLNGDGTIPAPRLINTIIKGNNIPTTSTQADYVGQLYQTPFGQTYICKSINTVEINGTITGNLEVYDGVVVGCDHSNTTTAFINTGKTFSASSSWEVIQKVYVSAPSTRQSSTAIIVPSGGSGDVYIDNANKMHVNQPGSASSTVLESDAWTWVKVYCDGSAQTKIDCLTDDGYTLETLPTTGWTTFNTVAKNIFGGYYLKLSPSTQGYFPTDHKCTQIKENGTVIFTGTTALETPEYIWRPVGDLYNKYNTAQSLSICGKIDNAGAGATAVGYNSQAGSSATALGQGSNASGSGAVAIGRGSIADGQDAIAIGYSACSISSKESIQIGKGINPHSRTFRIGLPKLVGTSYPTGYDDETGCYELLNTDGEIPGERLTNTVLKGTTAPTALTQAQYIGQFYNDITNDKMYRCKSIDKTGDRQMPIVGTLTETNHDISGFSTADYMTMDYLLNPDNYNEGFEINFGFTLTTLGQTHCILGCGTQYKNGIAITVNTSNKLAANISLNGTSWGITLTCSTTLSANKKYIGKLIYNKYYGYQLYVSYDTSYLQGRATNTTVNKPYYSADYPTWWVGKNGGGNYLGGTLHLDDFFIKLDNDKVFVPYYKSTWAELVDASNVYTKAEIDAMIGNIESRLAQV